MRDNFAIRFTSRKEDEKIIEHLEKMGYRNPDDFSGNSGSQNNFYGVRHGEICLFERERGELEGIDVLESIDDIPFNYEIY